MTINYKEASLDILRGVLLLCPSEKEKIAVTYLYHSWEQDYVSYKDIVLKLKLIIHNGVCFNGWPE